MAATLYVIPASHPCAAVERALELKGIAYDRVDLLPVIHKAVTKLRFGQGTVPALEFDGGRVSGSRLIMRTLDAAVPEPPLLPADPAKRGRVEDAERWGDEILQPAVRRMSWAVLSRRPDTMRSFSDGHDLPLPIDVAMLSAGLVARTEVLIHGAGDERARGDVAALPAQLDVVDGWIADGLLGGEQPNAADLQIGAAVRLLLAFGDLRPIVAGRPAEAYARELFPADPGDVPAGVLPADWLPVATRA